MDHRSICHRRPVAPARSEIGQQLPLVVKVRSAPNVPVADPTVGPAFQSCNPHPSSRRQRL